MRSVDFLNQLRGLLDAGVREQPLGSNYAPPVTDWYADYTGYEWARRAAWCAESDTYSLHHAGSDLDWFVYAYCPFIERDARNGVNGLGWSYTPVVGALVLYDLEGGGYATHVGAVEFVYDDGSFITLEGNWSDRFVRLHRDMKYVRGFAILPFDGQPTDPSLPTNESPSSTGGRPVLRLGSTGESVRTWQEILIGAHLLSGEGDQAADGIFGNATTEATKALQRQIHVDDDGVVGPATYGAVDILMAYLVSLGNQPAPAPEQPPAPSGGGLDEDGELGPETIKAMQRALGVDDDGDMGPNTITALQRRVGSPADGRLGKNTIRALQSHVGANIDGGWGPDTTLHLQQALNNGTF